jgi:hypothetical protein
MTAVSKRSVVLMLSFILLFAACAAHAPIETEWVALQEQAGDLDTARRACKARALDETKDIARPDSATRAASGIFMTCMREKGWELRQKIQPNE